MLLTVLCMFVFRRRGTGVALTIAEACGLRFKNSLTVFARGLVNSCNELHLWIPNSSHFAIIITCRTDDAFNMKRSQRHTTCGEIGSDFDLLCIVRLIVDLPSPSCVRTCSPASFRNKLRRQLQCACGPEAAGQGHHHKALQHQAPPYARLPLRVVRILHGLLVLVRLRPPHEGNQERLGNDH